MATLQDISNAYWQLDRENVGEVVQGLADIQQCVQVLLETRKGERVLDPEFGIDLLSYIDKPVNSVQSQLTSEIIAQIERYEPRVLIDSIKPVVEDSNLIFTISWTASAGQGTNIVRYATTS